MPISLKCDRAVFKKGEQREFLFKAKVLLNRSWKELSLILGLSERTITDWKAENSTIPLSAVTLLCEEAGINPPNFQTKNRFWYTKIGGKLGGAAVLKKYGRIGGDPNLRKEKWKIWWEKEGKFRDFKILRPFTFNKPKKSAKFAEFIGIMLGDGEMSKNQICITLHHTDDYDFAKYVIMLENNLFGIVPSLYHDPKYSVNNIVISRSGLVKYLNSLGLPIGNKIKQNIDMPEWIKKNPKFSVACLRGLVDTDGCIFRHKYKVNNKNYAYKKLSFTSYSRPLRRTVYKLLKKLGLKPLISQNKDVRLESQYDLRRYFQLIGSNNPKHLNKYFKKI